MLRGARESTGHSLEAPINASLVGRLTAVAAAAAIVVTTTVGAPSPEPSTLAGQAAQQALQRRDTTVAPASRSLARHPRIFPPAPVVRARLTIADTSGQPRTRPRASPTVRKQQRQVPRVRPRIERAREVVRERPARRVVRHRAVPHRSVASRIVPRRAPAARPVPRRTVVRKAVRPAGANPVVRFAYAQIGRPYVRNGTGRRGYDCSGLTRAAYARVGARLPHKAARQHGRAVRRGQARPGDLVKWGSYHVGIYVGAGHVIHAPKPGDRVKRARLWGSYRIVRVR